MYINRYTLFLCFQLFLLEEMRERKYDSFARVIQKAFRKWNAAKHYIRLRQQGALIVIRNHSTCRYSIYLQ